MATQVLLNCYPMNSSLLVFKNLVLLALCMFSFSWVRFYSRPLGKRSALHYFVFLLQAKSKELELMCSLKNVEFDPIEQEQSVGKLM